jgi:hypothetical protein
LRLIWLALGAFLFAHFPSPALADQLRLGEKTEVTFATIEEAKAILTNRDEFIAALSPFDRAARLKTDQLVTEREFLGHVGSSVLPWSESETNKLARVCKAIGNKVVKWNVPLPPKVLFIKTSGKEEADAAYTRQNAIVLPQSEVRSSQAALEKLVAHELFHVLSRSQPDLRKRLYGLIGFTPINAVDYPDELRERKITNPDGVQDGWLITVTNLGRPSPTIPILYATTDRYNPAKGGEFFQYLTFKLLAVTNVSGHWQPELAGGHPVLLEPTEAQGYVEQVGKNTHYIIHPDEILADNFVQFLDGETNAPSQRIIDGMRGILNATTQ